MRAGSRRLIRNGLGAVAPTVALSLFALIGVGGLAFDYARLASMDTELQSAADQAALAAATQLDGDDGACGRAIQAATTRLAAEAPWLANETRFANDSGGLLVQTTSTGGTSCTGHPNVTFWQDEDMVTPADGDATANFVQVQVEAREANYALTPVIGIISSGAISARALAGMQGSRIPVAVAHGEGRASFEATGDAARVAVALNYINGDGSPATSYPANPNGSAHAIAGVCSDDGRVTILMPHPERVFRSVQMSWRPREWGEDSPWMRMFRNARAWLA